MSAYIKTRVELIRIFSMNPFSRPVLLVSLGVLLLGVTSALYIALAPSLAHQEFDSLSYAYSVEINGISSIWGNHPLGHLIQNTTFILAKILGYGGRALTYFQIVNGVIGGIAIASFFGLGVLVFKFSVPNALGLAVLLGASYSAWHFAGTADIYNLSVLIQILALGSLVNDTLVTNRRYLIVSGVLVGLSILAHQLNITIIVAALVLATNEYRTAKIKLATFLGSLATTFVIGYSLLGYIATSSLSPQKILSWMRGYIGDPTYGKSLAFENVPIAFSNAVEAVVHIGWSTQAQIARILLVGLLLLPIAFGVLQARVIMESKQRRIIAACLLQCFVGWLLIFWWEPPPYNLKYWMLTFVPFLVATGYFAENLRGRLSGITLSLPRYPKTLGNIVFASYLPLLGISLLLFNLKFGIINEHGADIVFQEAINLWLEHSNTDDILIPDDHLVPILAYWNRRPNTLNLHTLLMMSPDSPDRLDGLRKTIEDALCSNKAVLFTPAAIDFHPDPFLSAERVTRNDLHLLFDEFDREETFSYVNSIDGKRTSVYRLSGLAPCR